MKYDLLCLPGTSPPGCGEVYVDARLPEGHGKDERVTILCEKCGSVREHEVRASLDGFERDADRYA